jgi:tetratricopeptide (TPR) repeat protein
LRISSLLASLLFFTVSISASAQNDSLKAFVNSAKSDTAKFRICNQLSTSYSASDNKTSLFFAQWAKTIAEAHNDKRGIAEAMNNIGYALYYSGKSDSALHVFIESVKIARAIGDSAEVIFAMNRMGFIYREKGDYPKALTAYNQSLASNIGEKNKSEAANSYLNIGVAYNDQGNMKDGLRYEEIGLKLYKETGEEARIANCMARIGNIYMDSKDTAKALDYYEQSRALFERSKNPRGVAVCLNNIANIYKGRHETQKAIDFYNRALAIRETIGDKNGVALICNNLGTVYLSLNNYEQAVFNLNKSLTIARELDYRDEMRSNYKALSETYEKLGDDKKALGFYKLFYDMNDSIYNEENSKKVNELNVKFDTERRQKAFESLSKENDLQQRRNFFMGCALLLLGILAFVIWRNATKSKRANIVLEKQKNEIALQKRIVDEQHRDMLDSINYAKRIQFAVLPTKEEMQELFPESFVFFRPRDIVSGDFWWIGQSGKTRIIAVADCTGHGVPGAFMSLIGNTALNEVVKEKHITDPGEILDRLAHNIVTALKQDSQAADPTDYSTGLVKDGMDIALCCIDEEKGELKFSGANNPIYYVNKNGIHEIKGDRQPVGIFTKELKPFTVHTIPLSEIDSFYIFTDGYADQFGGGTGKKFKYSRFKEELHLISGKSEEAQKNILEKLFDDWRGNLDQVDDVLVAGIRLK